MRGLNLFLWIGTPALFLLVGLFVWTVRRANDRPPKPIIAAAPIVEYRYVQAQPAQTRLPDLARYKLAGNQRCYGGVVVQVEGSTYTQVQSNDGITHCWNGYADRPIR